MFPAAVIVELSQQAEGGGRGDGRGVRVREGVRFWEFGSAADAAAWLETAGDGAAEGQEGVVEGQEGVVKVEGAQAEGEAAAVGGGTSSLGSRLGSSVGAGGGGGGGGGGTVVGEGIEEEHCSVM